MRTLVSLSCAHVEPVVDKTLSQGDELMCSRCNRIGWVVQVDAEYRLKCVTCHHGAHFGMSRLTMERAASRHLRNRPTHTVQLLSGDRIIQILKPSRLQNTLPNLLDPPF